jgi:tetratricopeptide (TPR) repeat protein
MKKRNNSIMLVCLAAAFVGQGLMQRLWLFDRWVKDFNPGKGRVYTNAMSPEQILAVLAGFREITAGILWVKADSFFDQGNYDAILPLIRLVTILDPNEIDVYATGMWHIGYNFTDEEQRSDRRYIPSALALGREGTIQNPDTYELFFEEGWLWYHKIDDDYQNAVYWFLKAQEHADMLPARKNLLGMAYQRTGEINKSIDTYYRLYDDAAKRYIKENAFGNHQNRDTLEGNLDSMLVREVQRGYIAEMAKKPLTSSYDAYPPFDVGFSVKATVVEPSVIRFEGTWNVLPVGTRIRVVLRDLDFPHAKPAEMDWDFSKDVDLDPPRDETFMQEQLFVRNRRFNKKVDMSKDPTMYPFTKDNYVMEFYYNPRSAPPHIQDKFSWSGEGMTDKNFLNTEIRPGQRVIFASLPITRDMIKHYGQWVDKIPVVKTANYVESAPDAGRDDDVVLKIPSLRGTAGAK